MCVFLKDWGCGVRSWSPVPLLFSPLLCTDLVVKRDCFCVCWSFGVVEAEMEREVLLVSLSNMPLGRSCEFSSLSEAFDFWGLCRYSYIEKWDLSAVEGGFFKLLSFLGLGIYSRYLHLR